MRFFLMRHCEAVAGEQLDTERGLTQTGKDQRKVVARFLQTQTSDIGAVLCSSDLRRGIQTGEWLADKLGADLVQSPDVDPPNNEGTVSDAEIRKCWKTIKTAMSKLKDGKELLVISHGPMINALASFLLGSDQGARFHFSHAAVMRLDEATPADYKGVYGRGAKVLCFMHWFASAKMMNRAMEDDEDAQVGEALALVDSMLAEAGVQFDLAEKGGSYTYEETLLKRVTEGGSVAGACEPCDENIAAGFIDSEEVYPSGDDGPPFHVNCVCAEEYKISRKRVYD